MSSRSLQSRYPVSNDPQPDAPIDLTVVIVNYNVRDYLEQALRSVIRASSSLEVEIIVVDNNSVDGSLEMVREQFTAARVIANKNNVGFGAANNQALLIARGRFILILNPDTIVQEDTLETLVGFMDRHPDAGAVGCKILNPDGSFAPESRRSFPLPSVALFRMLGLSRIFPHSRTFGRYNLTYLPQDEVTEVDALSGSCMLLRYEALRHPAGKDSGDDSVLLFDEDFFMYGEDLDLCYRIQEAGWKIFYTPDTQIIHFKGQSTKKSDLVYVRHFYGAMLLFARKHFNERYSSLVGWTLRAGIRIRAGVSILSNVLRRLRAPITDALTVVASVTLVGLLRTAQLGTDVSGLFLATIPAAYAVVTALATTMLGGYVGGTRPLRPALAGLLVGLLVVSALSFFVKGIAFSRLIVVLTYPVAAIGLAGVRILSRRVRVHDRKALLVGDRTEAARLGELLRVHPNPPFKLVGFVSAVDPDTDSGTDSSRLGDPEQTRDLVRLRYIDDIVFAAASLTNHTMLEMMRSLRDLPVRFRILVADAPQLIARSSVSDLSTPAIVEASAVLRTPTVGFRHALFERTIAAVGLGLFPWLLLARTVRPTPWMEELLVSVRRFPSVLSGRLSLVGFNPDAEFVPPPEWNLRPGVFFVSDAVEGEDRLPDLRRTYAFYGSNRSATLDLEVMRRGLSRRSRRRGRSADSG